MKTYFVVTGVIKHEGKVLILKKKDDDYNYPGKWSFCSGFVKEFEPAEDTVIREIKEETGLIGKITKKGKLLIIPDKKKKKNWVVAVFLCSVNSKKVRLDNENIDYKWINYNELGKFDTVPGLDRDLKALGLK